MSSRPLAEEYLRWLAFQVEDDSGRTFSDLMAIMFETEYPEQAALAVPNDENRLGDAIDLRKQFFREIGQSDELGPPSFLEVLIALSRRLEFNAGGSARGWAWQLVVNLDLDRMWDPLSSYKRRKIGAILDRCIWRTYEPNGLGGFFPLVMSERDQRKMEIWFQMAEYINELNTTS